MSRKIKVEEEKPFVARNEILQVADMVAREKGIERDDILDAMEQAILKTAQMKYGEEKKLEVVIDRKTGAIDLYRLFTISETVNDPHNEIALSDVLKKDGDYKVGDVLRDKLPALDFGRVAAQSARQVITQKVRAAERNKQYEDFAGRVGEIISGVVKRIEYSDIVLDILDRTEGIIKRSETIPRENFRVGDRVKVFLVGLNKDAAGPLLKLSRTHPDFLKKLFEQEVPEVYDGIVKIVAVARDPGSKAKVAVMTNDPKLDPVGACVGVKGSRVQAITEELKGEKIDIIPWAENPAMFIVNSVAPADVTQLVMEETGDRVTAVVPDDQLSAAIGRRGQNVRLASRLTGWGINVTSETEETNARAKENENMLKSFMEGLDVDEMVAHLLIGEGFSSVEEIASAPITELASIEGFDEELAGEIQQRAAACVSDRKDRVLNLCKDKGVSKELAEYDLLKPELLEVLVNAGIKTLDDLGDLSTDELLEIAGELLNKADAEALIMKIRERWFS